VAQSWFEDDPELSQAVERARGRDRAKLATYLLQSVMARHRDKWAEVILSTALWMREAPPEADLCWRELAIVAKALADGRDMTEIGLMRDIALRTIAVLGAPRGRGLS
jgi:DNA-binding NarL/FixJ family response regulator